MPLTNYALDRFVSQDLSQLTECNAPEVASRFSQSSYWVSNFILNSILRCPVGQEGRRFAFAFLRRAEAVFVEYEHARRALIELTEATSKSPSVYFRALYHLEASIAMFWQAYTFVMRLTGERLFQNRDGSTYERLNRIYNVGRHFNPPDLLSGHLHAVWITNGGIQIEGCSLSYTEIEGLLMEIGSLADRISELRRDDNTSAEL